MCCCKQPTINGQPGYKWHPNDRQMVLRPDPPELQDGDTMIYDEPGRCGCLDAHSHHFRVAKSYAQWWLLIKHGAGQERIALDHTKSFLDTLQSLDTNARYWLLHAIYHAASDAVRNANEKTNKTWAKAAAEKRIKTRKYRGTDQVKVWIA